MATEIAKVYVDDISIANLEAPALAKPLPSQLHLTQKQICDYAKLAEQEEKAMTDVMEQTISVSRAATMERLLTISLLRLAKYDEIKIAAAGGSINDAVSLGFEVDAVGKFLRRLSASNCFICTLL